MILLAASSPLLFAADCASLKNLQLANTGITLAEPVTGTLDIPDAGVSLTSLPAFCRVAGALHPTSDSDIQFEVWLPAQGWNGRILGTGNGGFAGAIYYPQMAAYLQRGFAVSGTDAGHEAENTDATFAWGHPEKVKDFGWRALHLTAETTKQILNTYYGKPADKSYYDGCSDGGREGLMEAQRFPGDYDGILAGAPANAWTALLTDGAGVMQVLMNDPKAYIPDGKLAAMQRASLAACDALDGAKDSVIGDPSKCSFDPQVLLCKSGDAADCLTQPQIDAARKLYAGIKDSRGQIVFPGLTMGDETGWKEWVVGEDPGGVDLVAVCAELLSLYGHRRSQSQRAHSKRGRAVATVQREASRRPRCHQSRPERLCSARRKAHPLSRLERSRDRTRKHRQLLRNGAEADGRRQGRLLCSSLHDSRHGALHGRSRRNCIRTVWRPHREGVQIRPLRLAPELGREGFTRRERDRNEVQRRQEWRHAGGLHAPTLRLAQGRSLLRLRRPERCCELHLRRALDTQASGYLLP
jgi:hypothetical protein